MISKSELSKSLIIAMIVASILFIPLTIYTYLLSGSILSTVGASLLLLLYSEILSLRGYRPRKQTLFLIYVTSIYIASIIPTSYWLIYRCFLRISPVFLSYSINGKLLSELIPVWMAPEIESESLLMRTLFHPDWKTPLLIYVTQAVLSFIAELTLAVIFSMFYIEIEKLPFPIAKADASLISTLSGEDPEKMKIFMLALSPGIAYGITIYVLPFMTNYSIIPLPWIDFTPLAEQYLPGSLFGLATDPTTFLFGLLIPFENTLCVLIGSVITWVIGNNLLLTVFPNLFPLWKQEFFQGMNLRSLYERSLYRVWLGPQIGLAIGLAIFYLVKLRLSLYNMIKFFFRRSTSQVSEYPSIRNLFCAYFLAVGLSLLLFWKLIPEFPLEMAVFGIVLSFLVSLVGARAIGEIGLGISVPYLWHMTVYLSPYNGLSAWLFTPAISYGASSTWVQWMKAGYMLEVSPKDFFKALAISFVLANLFGLVAIDVFWRIAPIPSSLYPYTILDFPIRAVGDALWATRKIGVTPMVVAMALVTSIGICIAGEILKFSPVGLISGVFWLPPYAIMVFMGGLLAKFLFSKIWGKEYWEAIAGTLVAGVFTGIGIAVGLSIAFSFIFKAAWIWPW